MEHRGIQVFVVAFWIAATCWLVTTKIAPALGTRDRPDQRVFRPESSSEIDYQAWKISWNDRPIGWARSTTRQFSDGQGHVESRIRLENLTARQMLKEMFGTAAFMLRALDLGGIDEDLNLGCHVSTEMNFDAYGHLKRFASSLDVDSVGELLSTRGMMGDGRLRVDVHTGAALDGVSMAPIQEQVKKLGVGVGGKAAAGEGGELEDDGQVEPGEGVLLSRQFEIPPDALVADSLLPQSRLTGLKIGQRWTFQAYRAYPPQNPLRDMEAKVERQEMLSWQDEIESVFVVSFRDISGSGLTANSEPSSWLWVRRDGTVLKQQMRMGNVTVDFTRCELADLPADEIPSDDLPAELKATEEGKMTP